MHPTLPKSAHICGLVRKDAILDRVKTKPLLVRGALVVISLNPTPENFSPGGSGA
jgi:hypothetical protein